MQTRVLLTVTLNCGTLKQIYRLNTVSHVCIIATANIVVFMSGQNQDAKVRYANDVVFMATNKHSTSDGLCSQSQQRYSYHNAFGCVALNE